jgi:RNA polymerase sigma factor (sigma-70 family)
MENACPNQLSDLLAQAAWVQRLARRLVPEPDAADDVVQETWAAVARRPPDGARPPRPWLAEVLRNFARLRFRNERRRRERDASAAALAEPHAASPEELLARVEMQKLLVELVLGLAEPYRSTLLLRFFEERSTTEIARLHGVDPAAVRWRLRTALERLRAQLDDRHEGGRRAWVAAALPLGGGKAQAAVGRLGIGTGPAVTAAAFVAFAGLVVGLGASGLLSKAPGGAAGGGAAGAGRAAPPSPRAVTTGVLPAATEAAARAAAGRGDRPAAPTGALPAEGLPLAQASGAGLAGAAGAAGATGARLAIAVRPMGDRSGQVPPGARTRMRSALLKMLEEAPSVRVASPGAPGLGLIIDGSVQSCSVVPRGRELEVACAVELVVSRPTRGVFLVSSGEAIVQGAPAPDAAALQMEALERAVASAYENVAGFLARR